MPGVSHLPCPSITTASDGASTLAPTLTIFPSRMSSAPLRMTGPAAVRMLTLRTTVVREGKGRYVLGNGSAFGVDSAPGPALPAREPPDVVVAAPVVGLVWGEGVCVAGCGRQAAAAASSATAVARRIASVAPGVGEGRARRGMVRPGTG